MPNPVSLIFSGRAGVSFVDATRVSIGNISIDYDPRPTKPLASITYTLVNSSEVLTQDLTIRSAPYMAVTAFTGGGNHTFAPGGGNHTFASEMLDFPEFP